ncbi:hypothetical protein D3C71_1759420 [compost metagenome]
MPDCDPDVVFRLAVPGVSATGVEPAVVRGLSGIAGMDDGDLGHGESGGDVDLHRYGIGDAGSLWPVASTRWRGEAGQ